MRRQKDGSLLEMMFINMDKKGFTHSRTRHARTHARTHSRTHARAYERQIENSSQQKLLIFPLNSSQSTVNISTGQ